MGSALSHQMGGLRYLPGSASAADGRLASNEDPDQAGPEGGPNVVRSRERRDGSPSDSPAWPALPIWTRSRSLVSRAGLASRGDANSGRVPLRSPAWPAPLTLLGGLDLTEQATTFRRAFSYIVRESMMSRPVVVVLVQ